MRPTACFSCVFINIGSMKNKVSADCRLIPAAHARTDNIMTALLEAENLLISLDLLEEDIEPFS